MKAVLPKTLLLIIYFNTFQDEAFGLPLYSGVAMTALTLHDQLMGKGAVESENLLENLVNLAKIPRLANEDNKKVTIKGNVASDVNIFTVELIDTSGSIGFHAALRFSEKTTVFNSYEKKQKVEKVQYLNVGGEKMVDYWAWGEEETYDELAIEPGSEFKIIISIIADEEIFEIDSSTGSQINRASYVSRAIFKMSGSLKLGVLVSSITTLFVMWMQNCTKDRIEHCVIMDINDEFYSYNFRTALENLIFLRIEGDVSITSVTWNGLID